MSRVILARDALTVAVINSLSEMQTLRPDEGLAPSKQYQLTKPKRRFENMMDPATSI